MAGRTPMKSNLLDALTAEFGQEPSRKPLKLETSNRPVTDQLVGLEGMLHAAVARGDPDEILQLRAELKEKRREMDEKIAEHLELRELLDEEREHNKSGVQNTPAGAADLRAEAVRAHLRRNQRILDALQKQDITHEQMATLLKLPPPDAMDKLMAHYREGKHLVTRKQHLISAGVSHHRRREVHQTEGGGEGKGESDGQGATPAGGSDGEMNASKASAAPTRDILFGLTGSRTPRHEREEKEKDSKGGVSTAELLDAIAMKDNMGTGNAFAALGRATNSGTLQRRGSGNLMIRRSKPAFGVAQSASENTAGTAPPRARPATPPLGDRERLEFLKSAINSQLVDKKAVEDKVLRKRRKSSIAPVGILFSQDPDIELLGGTRGSGGAKSKPRRKGKKKGGDLLHIVEFKSPVPFTAPLIGEAVRWFGEVDRTEMRDSTTSTGGSQPPSLLPGAIAPVAPPTSPTTGTEGTIYFCKLSKAGQQLTSVMVGDVQVSLEYKNTIPKPVVHSGWSSKESSTSKRRSPGRHCRFASGVSSPTGSAGQSRKKDVVESARAFAERRMNRLKNNPNAVLNYPPIPPQVVYEPPAMPLFFAPTVSARTDPAAAPPARGSTTICSNDTTGDGATGSFGEGKVPNERDTQGKNEETEAIHPESTIFNTKADLRSRDDKTVAVASRCSGHLVLLMNAPSSYASNKEMVEHVHATEGRHHTEHNRLAGKEDHIVDTVVDDPIPTVCAVRQRMERLVQDTKRKAVHLARCTEGSNALTQGGKVALSARNALQRSELGGTMYSTRNHPLTGRGLGEFFNGGSGYPELCSFSPIVTGEPHGKDKGAILGEDRALALVPHPPAPPSSQAPDKTPASSGRGAQPQALTVVASEQPLVHTIWSSNTQKPKPPWSFASRRVLSTPKTPQRRKISRGPMPCGEVELLLSSRRLETVPLHSTTAGTGTGTCTPRNTSISNRRGKNATVGSVAPRMDSRTQ